MQRREVERNRNARVWHLKVWLVRVVAGGGIVAQQMSSGTQHDQPQHSTPATSGYTQPHSATPQYLRCPARENRNSTAGRISNVNKRNISKPRSATSPPQLLTSTIIDRPRPSHPPPPPRAILTIHTHCRCSQPARYFSPYTCHNWLGSRLLWMSSQRTRYDARLRDAAPLSRTIPD